MEHRPPLLKLALPLHSYARFVDTSNVINLCLLVVTLVAAGAAIWQAAEARAARRDASRSSEDAATHERAAREAATSATLRMAEAAERQAVAAERSLHAKDPWRVDRMGQRRWRVMNKTGKTAALIKVVDENGSDIVEGDAGSIAPEQAFFVELKRDATPELQSEIHLAWYAPSAVHSFLIRVP